MGEDLAALNDRLMAKNHALAEALGRASKELARAKAQLSQMVQPPLSMGTMVRVDASHTDEQGVRHASAEVICGSRRLIVPVSATLNAARLQPGATVLLDQNMVVVKQRDIDGLGAIRMVKQVLDDGRLVVVDGSGNPTLVRPAKPLKVQGAGDRIVVDPSGRLALGLLPGEDDTDLVLEETPDVSFQDIGGLDAQIERIRDAVQLPFQHRALFERFDLTPPKGVLLYGPPGNGKTMIAKAIAHALSQGTSRGQGVFLSVKGPELLNKFVGESERLIRSIFTRARERAADGRPVIVFIDEMDSLLRTRGTGVSSDVETTIVPQFLAELDGVERLDNVMVIGASNRIDMIDPAVLRPGRLDVKIRIERPNETAARAIVRHYLTDELPLAAGTDADRLADGLVRGVYERGDDRRLADACDEHGVWSPVFLADVMSGASLKNIVDRAKTHAVKASILDGHDVALDAAMLASALEEECAETRDALLDVDPAQWARVNGFDAGRIVRLRPATVVHGEGRQNGQESMG